MHESLHGTRSKQRFMTHDFEFDKHRPLGSSDSTRLVGLLPGDAETQDMQCISWKIRKTVFSQDSHLHLRCPLLHVGDVLWSTGRPTLTPTEILSRFRRISGGHASGA